jgi:hypothetical protein
VPQGSVLGPTLFNIYINDIPTTEYTKMCLFADDAAILSSSWRPETIVKRLSHSAKNIKLFFTKWKIKLSESKPNCILFTKRRPLVTSTVFVANTPIPWSSEIKYLGVILDSKLTFTKHVNKLTTKGKIAVCNLFPFFSRNSKLSIDNKLLIYKTIVRPLITYAIPSWNIISKTNLRKLQIIQNKFLRLILDVPRYTPISKLHNDCKIQTIEQYCLNICNRFHNNRKYNGNPLIKAIGALPSGPHRHKRLKSN